MRLYSLFLVAIVASFSCSKPTEKDTQAPVVEIKDPLNNAVVPGNQDMYISGSAIDNRYVKQIHIEITNFYTKEEINHVHIHPATANAYFNYAYKVTSGITYQIRVLVDDASGNTSSPVTVVVAAR